MIVHINGFYIDFGINTVNLNPNKAGLFGGSFSWGGVGGQFDHPLHISRRTYLISM